MPLYNFKCCKCSKTTKKLMSVEDYKKLPGFIACECGCTATRDMQGGTSKAMEVLDNGLMARPIERLADTERIYAERATQHTRSFSTDDQLD